MLNWTKNLTFQSNRVTIPKLYSCTDFSSKQSWDTLTLSDGQWSMWTCVGKDWESQKYSLGDANQSWGICWGLQSNPQQVRFSGPVSARCNVFAIVAQENKCQYLVNGRLGIDNAIDITVNCKPLYKWNNKTIKLHHHETISIIFQCPAIFHSHGLSSEFRSSPHHLWTPAKPSM